MRNEFDDQNGLIAKVDPYDRPADRTGLWIGPSVIPIMPPRGGLMLGSRKGRECFCQVARRSCRASGTRHAAAFLTVPGGVPKLLLARQGEDDMQVSNTIDCNGLSPAPTLLRIMQALVGREDSTSPLNVLVGADCNCESLAVSLGPLAQDVQLASDAKQFAAVN